MSSLRIEQTLTLDAPPPEVWSCLVDPEVVVRCLPGAELTSSSEDGRTHHGSVKVKLGALTVAYRGTAEFVEIDHEARRLRIEAKGRERTGAGRVGLTLVSQVTATDSGSSVVVQADVRLAGKIVSLGRGVVGVVTKQLIADFSGRLSERLQAEGSGTTPPAVGASPAEAAPAEAFSLLVRAARSGLREQLARTRPPEREPDSKDGSSG